LRPYELPRKEFDLQLSAGVGKYFACLLVEIAISTLANQICEMMEISKPTLYKYIDASLANVGTLAESQRE
jgi:hypothetical protein